MGEMVEFKSNGGTCTGYLAGTGGPGVIVIQEWWGLVPHITDIADRFAAEGFVALAPDMYHGEMTDEPDMAGKLLMSMNLATAGKDLSGAVDLLQERTGRTKVGVTGFCMGGGLALMAACLRPDAIAAAAPTLSESISECIGMRTICVAFVIVFSSSPSRSLPINRATRSDGLCCISAISRAATSGVSA